MKLFNELVLLQVVGAAVACFAPTPWISFPAAGLLTLWFPGRLLVRALGWDEECAGRGWIALAVSVVLTPMPLSWVWCYSNSRWAILSALVAVDLVLLVLGRPSSTISAASSALFSTVRQRCTFAVIVLFVGGCVFGALWVPQAGGRMVVQPMGDYVKHHAVLLSLERHPLPLHNIFYAGEKDTPYFYYQYHHHIAAALRKLTADRISIAWAFAITSACTAMAFVAVTLLLAREFFGVDGRRGALLAAACVSVIGGWDIIPTVIRIALGAGSVIILDSWSSIAWRIHNLMTQFMWCPQHVAAMLAVILAARWLRQAPWSAGWIWIGPLLAASIFGSSVYLAMTVFAAAAIHLVTQMWSVPADRSRRRILISVSLMVLLGAVLMGPQAYGYIQMTHRMSGGLTIHWPRFEYAFIGRLASPGVLANFLDAPWILLVDFGLPAVACLLVSRKFWGSVWRDSGLRLLLLAGIIGIAAVFSMRSNHSPFDYSFRIAVMPAQVMGAICAGAMFRHESVQAWVRRRLRYVLVAAGLLGLPVGLYEAPLMVGRTLLMASPDKADAGAMKYLREQTPQNAVIQGDPVQRWGLPQLTDRQMGVTDDENSHVRVFYPKDTAAMRRTLGRVQEAFSTDSPHRAFELFHQAGIDYVLAGALERKLYGPLRQMDNDAWFECVYRDDRASVYRLREQPEGPRTPTHNPFEAFD